MPSLSSILQQKSQTIAFAESNLERGRVYYFNPGITSSATGTTLCWIAPAAGEVVVEVWGASGSGGKECCCGAGIPGNPGAYSKKTFNIASGAAITGTLGRSCGNLDQVTYRGRSEATCICYIGTSTSGTICAQGGRGGVIYNGSSGNSSYCCFIANGFPGTPRGSAGCGIICNFVAGENATASGGDINCSGGWSCAAFLHCNSCCQCSQYQHVAVSPGIFSQQGSVLTFPLEATTNYSQASGQGYHQLISTLNALSRTPNQGQPASYCWSGAQACGCYETHGCFPYLPHGVPGTSGVPCDNVRDPGLRGGHGAVRIKFIG